MKINSIKDIDTDWKVYFLMREWEIKHGESFLDYYDKFVIHSEQYLLDNKLLTNDLYERLSKLLDWGIDNLLSLHSEIAGYEAELKIMTLVCKTIAETDLINQFYEIVVEGYGINEIDELDEYEGNLEWCNFSSEYQYATNNVFEDMLD